MSSSVHILIKAGFPRHLIVTILLASKLDRSTSRDVILRKSLLVDMLKINFRTINRIKEAYTNLLPVKIK
jgi:hypothetical protein